MGRWSNSPYEVESLKRITINDLKKLGYLKPNVFLNQNVFWTDQYGERTSSITVIIETTEREGIITFDYKWQESHINYRVRLITRPSNLGDGLLWFFVCPNTQKVCRKLHLNRGYFLHRTAFRGLYYEKQLESKRWREWGKVFSSFQDEKIYEEMYKKHFKKYYKGRPTKKYLQLMKRLNTKKALNFEDIEKFLLA